MIDCACPVCDGPSVSVSMERNIRIGSRSAEVLDEFLRCTKCDEEFYLPGQMDALQLRASARIREEEGLLQPREVRAIRQGLGLSQSDFERLLGVGPKTVVRWEKGTVFQNRATDALLRLVRDVPGSARLLSERSGVELGEGVTRGR